MTSYSTRIRRIAFWITALTFPFALVGVVATLTLWFALIGVPLLTISAPAFVQGIRAYRSPVSPERARGLFRASMVFSGGLMLLVLFACRAVLTGDPPDDAGVFFCLLGTAFVVVAWLASWRLSRTLSGERTGRSVAV